jgi:hypothetical protein
VLSSPKAKVNNCGSEIAIFTQNSPYKEIGITVKNNSFFLPEFFVVFRFTLGSCSKYNKKIINRIVSRTEAQVATFLTASEGIKLERNKQ